VDLRAIGRDNALVLLPRLKASWESPSMTWLFLKSSAAHT